MLKYLFLVLFLFTIVFEQGQTIKYNSLLQRYDCRDQYRNSSGYIKQNELLKRFDVYDKYGNRKGSWKKNKLLDQWEYKEK